MHLLHWIYLVSIETVISEKANPEGHNMFAQDH